MKKKRSGDLGGSLYYLTDGGIGKIRRIEGSKESRAAGRRGGQRVRILLQTEGKGSSPHA